MASFSMNDVILVSDPFSDLSASKIRPAREPLPRLYSSLPIG